MTSSCQIHHLSVMNLTRYSREIIQDENWLAAAARQGLRQTAQETRFWFLGWDGGEHRLRVSRPVTTPM
ncbi:hypothetical protein IEO70_01665 [Bacillus sp. AGMB 02131]|uniref:Uncharacterized protein n=1 Tax=Peribacillus faecalis TaxID=2772559 RepID=A0A927CTT1_9BACI|nr:hypothetical protein [Peribacillus faecalis]MBD3107074.1 hypothetical protein [Peribacillus faecalis]